MAMHIAFESDDGTTDLSGVIPQAIATRETPVRTDLTLPEITDEPRSEALLDFYLVTESSRAGTTSLL